MAVASCSQSDRTQQNDGVSRKGLQRTLELERRQQSCVACRFLHEVQYHTMGCITAVVAATAEEQVPPHHPRRVYHGTAVQQSTAEKPIHQQPAISTCVYKNTTAVQQKKKNENAETSEIQLTLCPESSALPLSQYKNVVITYPLRRATLRNRGSPSLAATPVLSPGIARAAV